MSRAEAIQLPTAEGPMGLYEVRPDGDARGAVIVVQEAFGVNEHIQDVTRRFADQGYHAVAPAFFHRAGGGTAEYGDWDAVLPLFAGLSDEGVVADVDATLDHLRAAGWDDRQVGIVGFCFGGRVSFLVALRRALGAAVGFYGGGIVTEQFPVFPSLVDEAGSLVTPWLGLFGDLDTSIPVEDVERLRETLAAEAPVDAEVVRYPEAGHGFHCDRRDLFHEPSAADAWQRTLAWFEAHLG